MHNKPSTILIQDFIVNHLRQTLIAETSKYVGSIVDHCQTGPDPDYKPADLEQKIPRFQIRPVVAGEVDNSWLDTLQPIHVEFAAFNINEPNPQISCHMIARIFWNVNMRQELVSIRFRFNLFSPHKTNAYVTYL